MFFRKAFLCLLAMSLAACAAKGPIFSGFAPPKTDSASVVIYRPHTTINSGGYPHIYLNQEKRGKLLDTGYLAYDLAPGNYKIALTNPAFWDGKQEWEITAAAGERQYFRVLSGDYSFRVSGSTYYTSKTVTVEKVGEADALAELKALHSSE